MFRRLANIFRGPPPPPPSNAGRPAAAASRHGLPSTSADVSDGGEGEAGRTWLPEMLSDRDSHLNKHDEEIDAAMDGLRGLASAGNSLAGGGRKRMTNDSERVESTESVSGAPSVDCADAQGSAGICRAVAYPCSVICLCAASSPVPEIGRCD